LLLFHEAWDRYKDLLRACPHHGFTELHQLDTFYNALNPTDQDSLNSVAGGNLLERTKLTNAVNRQTSVVTTAMRAILKQFQATPPPASVKAVEEICVTCGGAYPYYQCLAADGNTFPEYRDNIQGYVAAAVGGLVLDGPSVPMTLPFINPEEDERVEETLTDPKHGEFTIKVPPTLVQKAKPPSQRNYVVHQRDPRHPHIPYPSRMNQEKQKEKDKEEFEDCLASDSFLPGNSNPSSLLPPFHNSLSGNTTSSSPSLPISETSDYFLEEFADELALITFPPRNDDLPINAESDL
ncbi:hypothetical protein Tco_0963352, partial [Tanacetum coccineum]